MSTSDTLRLRWLGTAGFRLEAPDRKHALLLDPYLSRNELARPPRICDASELFPAEAALISHGHFDHLMDLPGLQASFTGPICLSHRAATTLDGRGVPRSRLEVVDAGWMRCFGPFRVRAYPIRHVRFGLKLVLRTLGRLGLSAPRYLPLLLHWPCGQPFAFRIDIAGYSIVHMGTAGATDAELDRIAADGRPDLLLVALQGNDRIHDIAAHIVDRLRPAMVMPEHQDDFYPPISEEVPVEPFFAQVAKLQPQTRHLVLAPGASTELALPAVATVPATPPRVVAGGMR